MGAPHNCHSNNVNGILCMLHFTAVVNVMCLSCHHPNIISAWGGHARRIMTKISLIAVLVPYGSVRTGSGRRPSCPEVRFFLLSRLAIVTHCVWLLAASVNQKKWTFPTFVTKTLVRGVDEKIEKRGSYGKKRQQGINSRVFFQFL